MWGCERGPATDEPNLKHQPSLPLAHRSAVMAGRVQLSTISTNSSPGGEGPASKNHESSVRGTSGAWLTAVGAFASPPGPPATKQDAMQERVGLNATQLGFLLVGGLSQEGQRPLPTLVARRAVAGAGGAPAVGLEASVRPQECASLQIGGQIAALVRGWVWAGSRVGGRRRTHLTPPPLTQAARPSLTTLIPTPTFSTHANRLHHGPGCPAGRPGRVGGRRRRQCRRRERRAGAGPRTGRGGREVAREVAQKPWWLVREAGSGGTTTSLNFWQGRGSRIAPIQVLVFPARSR